MPRSCRNGSATTIPPACWVEGRSTPSSAETGSPAGSCSCELARDPPLPRVPRWQRPAEPDTRAQALRQGEREAALQGESDEGPEGQDQAARNPGGLQTDGAALA